ncbi:hypothetical protein ABW19_dt0203742 [Dactylella cylindrospora]|nr:hypothetical protein ABW19_dt0203742 [Dactylella cylindrospora]
MDLDWGEDYSSFGSWGFGAPCTTSEEGFCIGNCTDLGCVEADVDDLIPVTDDWIEELFDVSPELIAGYPGSIQIPLFNDNVFDFNKFSRPFRLLEFIMEQQETKTVDQMIDFHFLIYRSRSHEVFIEGLSRKHGIDLDYFKIKRIILEIHLSRSRHRVAQHLLAAANEQLLKVENLNNRQAEMRLETGSVLAFLLNNDTPLRMLVLSNIRLWPIRVMIAAVRHEVYELSRYRNFINATMLTVERLNREAWRHIMELRESVSALSTGLRLRLAVYLRRDADLKVALNKWHRWGGGFGFGWVDTNVDISNDLLEFLGVRSAAEAIARDFEGDDIDEVVF